MSSRLVFTMSRGWTLVSNIASFILVIVILYKNALQRHGATIASTTPATPPAMAASLMRLIAFQIRGQPLAHQSSMR